jgi:transcriptional regulator with XRE-family HTH domain
MPQNDPSQDAYQTTGMRIRRLRTVIGCTVPEFARITHTAVSTLEGYENGRKRPSLQRLEAIARAGGVDVDDLIDDDLRPRIAKARSVRAKVALRFPGAAAMRRAREQKNMTLRGLAHTSDVRYRSILRYEAGLDNLTRNEAQRCADALGVRPSVIAPQHFAKTATKPDDALYVNETIGQRFARLRRERNLRCAFVAAKIGIDSSNLFRIEAGQTKEPSVFIVERAAAFFGVSVSYLICQSNVRSYDTAKPARVRAVADKNITALERTVAEHHAALTQISTSLIGLTEKFDTLLSVLQERAKREPGFAATDAPVRKTQ